MATGWFLPTRRLPLSSRGDSVVAITQTADQASRRLWPELSLVERAEVRAFGDDQVLTSLDWNRS